MMIQNKEIPGYMIGTWAWGAGMNGSKMVFGKKYDEQDLEDTFCACMEQGLFLWDTAEVYGMGNAEKILGKCISKHSGVLISTKHQPNKKYKAGEVEKAIRGSLDRLGLKRIDLYWLHIPNAIKENISEMAECVKKGLIQEIGLSNCNVEQIKEAEKILKQYGLKLAAVQNHYSLLSMERQKEVLDYCAKNKITYFGYMILEQGALSGYYNVHKPFPLLSMRRLTFGKRKFRKIQELLDYQWELAEKYNVDVSQIPIIWAKSKGIIPIIGLTKEKYVKALVQGMKVELNQNEIEKLEWLAKESGVECKGSWE